MALLNHFAAQIRNKLQLTKTILELLSKNKKKISQRFIKKTLKDIRDIQKLISKL